MRAIFAFVIVAACLSFASAGDVLNLSPESFASTVGVGTKGTFIKFFAPWCGHCKKMTATWEELATQVKDKVNVAEVDCTVHKDLCGQFGVRGYPTLKFFPAGETKNPIDYKGQRTVADWTNYLKTQKAIDGEPTPAAAPAPAPVPAPPTDTGDVQHLNPETFKTVVGGAQGTFIKFFAPWCGHCKRMVDSWKQFATQFKGKVNVAEVDCTVHADLCGQFGVRGYPTLKFFPAGESKKPIDYNGQRAVADWTNFLKTNNVITDADIPAPAADKKEL